MQIGFLQRIRKASFYGISNCHLGTFQGYAVFLTVVLCLVNINITLAASRQVTVQYVIDGDTVVLANGEKVRLLGINAPEKQFENAPAQPYALEARLAMQEMLEGKLVNLTIGKQKLDSYGRTLGYFELQNGKDPQKQLLERGYAFVVAFPPDIQRLDRYLRAEIKARSNRLGVWQDPYYLPQDAHGKVKIRTGFGLFKGTIGKVRKSRKYLLIALGDAIVLTIRHQAWDSFWHGSANRLTGKQVEVRGWVNRIKGKNYLRLRHPSMLRILQ